MTVHQTRIVNRAIGIVLTLIGIGCIVVVTLFSLRALRG